MSMTELEPARIDGARIDRGAFVRPVASSDIPQLAHTVGMVVDDLYPAGWLKLETKLRASTSGRPNAFVVAYKNTPSTPVALAAESHKGVRRAKLSTFWVAPAARGARIGSMLLDSRISSWLHNDLDSVSVTVREDRAVQLLPLFSKRGFRAVALDHHRYGEGKHELALEWRPSWFTEAGYSVDSFLHTLRHMTR